MATSKHWDFWRVSNVAEILKGTEPGPSFSQLVHDHLSQLSKEFEHYFLTTKGTQTGKQGILETFVNKLGESTFNCARMGSIP